MAAETATWTVAQRDRLPDDGNRYEVVAGELFVTPMPSWRHQFIARDLFRLLDPFVLEQQLGTTFDLTTDVIGSERDVVVPDVVVYPFTRETSPATAAGAPRPILVAEIRSPTTWRRDIGPKRDLYLALGIPDYWIVDADARAFTVVRPGHTDERVADILRWHPTGAARALEIDVATLLR
ncbi:MAG: Uma2 family endonuclease [Gemmatimonadales bacterium]